MSSGVDAKILEVLIATSKRANQAFALNKLRYSKHLPELMLIYNMGNHLTPSDPAGVGYIRKCVSGPTPKVQVDLHVLCELFAELDGAVTLMEFNSRAHDMT